VSREIDEQKNRRSTLERRDVPRYWSKHRGVAVHDISVAGTTETFLLCPFSQTQWSERSLYRVPKIAIFNNVQ